jgi:hypothetical protein
MGDKESAMETLVVPHGVSKMYEEAGGKPVLNGVSLAIAAGSMTAIHDHLPGAWHYRHTCAAGTSQFAHSRGPPQAYAIATRSQP